MLVFIEDNVLFCKEIEYIFDIFSKNKGVQYRLTKNANEAELVVSSDPLSSDIYVSSEFYNKLSQGQYNHKYYFKDDCIYTDSSGRKDYLSTAFYMINTIQEINDDKLDHFGRYQYSSSFQKKFNNVQTNTVQFIFDELFNTIPKFKDGLVRRSRIFLSHDIDTVYGSMLQDGFYTIKKFRFDLFLKILLINVLEKPHWLNIDRIMNIESKYDFVSTFYWLVNKGKTKFGLNNSDYYIKDEKIRREILNVDNSKWENGLHKSASDDSFQKELGSLPCKVRGNRFHYIKFNPNVDYDRIEKANIEFDGSLGFAEVMGFRNGYGLPFQPYNLKERRKFNFIECPLNVMDTTYFNYQKKTAVEFLNDTIKFVDENKSSAIISVLFHNNYFSEYKYGEYFNSIKKLLGYFYDSNLKCINQSEIIKEFKDED